MFRTTQKFTSIYLPLFRLHFPTNAYYSTIKPNLKLLQQLRQETQVSITKAKEALIKYNNDYGTALSWILEDSKTSGSAKAEKLKGRIAKEGLVGVALTKGFEGRTGAKETGMGNTRGAIVEVNCETDFVSRNTLFQQFVTQVASTSLLLSSDAESISSFSSNNASFIRPISLPLLQSSPLYPHPSLTSSSSTNLPLATVQESMMELIGKLGENISLRRADAVVLPDMNETSNVINDKDIILTSGYVHGGDLFTGKIGGLVVMKLSSKATKQDSTLTYPSEQINKLLRNLSRQIVGFNPQFISEKHVKVIPDGINKDDYLKENVLLCQDFLIGGGSVRDVIEKVEKEFEITVEIIYFRRWECGEGIKKSEENFASEVMCQAELFVSMSLLDAINRLNERDEHSELGENGIKDVRNTNGIEKQVNGIKPELVNGNAKEEDRKNESDLLVDILDPSSTPTVQEMEKKIRNFAAQSESEYLQSRLKIHSIEPKKYFDYLKINSKKSRNSSNKSAKPKKGQRVNSDDANSYDKDIFNLASWQKEIEEEPIIDIEALQSEYFEMKSNELIMANTRIPLFTSDFIKRIVSYCISQNPDGTPNMKFWSSTLFQFLIGKNVISNSYVKDGIVKAFIERNSLGLLKLALTHVPDIPEKDLVYLLKYLISHNSQFSKSEKKKPLIKEFFSLIIHAPRNDNKMMKALKDLNEDELLFIIQIFRKWIKIHGDTDVMPELMSSGKAKDALLKKVKHIPDFRILIDFMSLIFDVHFSTLILSEELHPSLDGLSKLITYELSIYESFESMRGCLALFHQKRHIKSVKNSSTDDANTSIYDRKNITWLNDGDIPIYSVELFSFYGEDNEDNFKLDEMDIDVDETIQDN
ncbi:5425_t:CDS:2 [Funneliformis caledonium]|uniref:Elongation factor Ts, mitochondrial n=1 Tax=Funneliformis caledonium TaxID=1117310 RepID=A0A9N9C7L0_9GLOM|nr:5425_t:CDS:2 [Funneliformis caledonium]